MNPTQELIRRERRTQEETRRATVISDLVLIPYNTSGLRSRVWVVDVDIGDEQPIRGVIVMSQTGTGGRAYARLGKAVIIRRNVGGRWVCVGPSDRTSSTGNIQILTESTGAATAPTPGIGLQTRRRTFDFYAGDLPGTPGSGRFGTAGFGNVIVEDAQGNEVF